MTAGALREIFRMDDEGDAKPGKRVFESGSSDALLVNSLDAYSKSLPVLFFPSPAWNLSAIFKGKLP